jgi:hypothetical protein
MNVSELLEMMRQRNMPNNVLHQSQEDGRDNPVVLPDVRLRSPSCAGETYRWATPCRNNLF